MASREGSFANFADDALARAREKLARAQSIGRTPEPKVESAPGETTKAAETEKDKVDPSPSAPASLVSRGEESALEKSSKSGSEAARQGGGSPGTEVTVATANQRHSGVLAKLQKRGRMHSEIDMSPERRALRRQKLTDTLSDLRTNEFLNLGLHRRDQDVLDEDKQIMLATSESRDDATFAINADDRVFLAAAGGSGMSSLHSPVPRWVYNGAKTRAAPRQLSAFDSPALASQEHRALSSNAGALQISMCP